MLTLGGRTCVFAGATGNIGEGAVRALCRGGMNVAMVTHDPDRAKAVIERLGEYSHRCIALSNRNGDTAVYGEIADRFGSLDVVINKTGAFDAVKPLEEITVEELNGKLTKQVGEAFRKVQEALPYLRKSKAGRVIFAASAGAQNGMPYENLCDSVARAGVINLTYCLARLLAGEGITVNCIAASGLINDHEPVAPGQLDCMRLKDIVPVGRIGSADEFGAAVEYLASEEAAFITGQVINLSGGLNFR